MKNEIVQRECRIELGLAGGSYLLITTRWVILPVSL